MCKPGKSFNTGIKSYSLRHMKMPCKSSRAGGAPPRTDALIGPAAFGDVQKTDCLKRRASGAFSLSSSGALTLLNMAWTSLKLREAAPSNARRSAGLSPWKPTIYEV